MAEIFDLNTYRKLIFWYLSITPILQHGPVCVFDAFPLNNFGDASPVFTKS